MTKVSVLGQEPVQQLKKIEFTHFLLNGCQSFNYGKDGDSIHKPNEVDETILISKDYGGFDVMLARKDGEDALYFGHWNDGVV